MSGSRTRTARIPPADRAMRTRRGLLRPVGVSLVHRGHPRLLGRLAKMRSSVRRMVPPLQTSILCRDRIAGILWRGDSLDHSPAHALRFGDFELDVRAGELRQGEHRIRLQEQPFQILLMLLEHPGEVVTREEIRKRLWPNDTIVEFDHSIGTAIKKLRQALGDEAESPRYVETLQRRGFRLMVSVDVGPGLAPASVDDAARPPQGAAL